MKLPNIKRRVGSKKLTITRFTGLSRGNPMDGGSICDMRNMTTAAYPALATRERRKVMLSSFTTPQGMCEESNTYLVAAGNRLYRLEEEQGTSLLGGQMYETVSSRVIYTGLSSGKKQMAAIGGSVVIFPDKLRVTGNTVESLEHTVSIAAGTATFRDGVVNGVTGSGNTLRAGVGAFAGLAAGDAVAISGCTTLTANNKTAIIRAINDQLHELYFDTGTFVNGTEPAAVTVSRTVPALEGITVCDNRLWGFAGDTLYASRLGDPTNFSVFDGLSTDSYSVTVPSPGVFTACTCYEGRPVFFKEHEILQMYGGDPSEYSLVTVTANGVQRGCGASAVVCAGALYYLSCVGVYRFTGGLPEPVGAALGDYNLSAGNGASDGTCYYLSAAIRGEAVRLLVYDTRLGMWSAEDETNICGWAYSRMFGGMYLLSASGRLLLTGAYRRLDTGVYEDAFGFSCTFGAFVGQPAESDMHRFVTGLTVRLTLGASSFVSLWLSVGDGPFEIVKTLDTAAEKQTYDIPLLPRRDERCALKLTGQGSCKVQSVSWIYSDGTALH